MGVKTTTAYLIHRYPWRDTSLIGQFLTPQGMLSVILKGVHRKKSPLAAGLLPFLPIQLSYSGRSDLKTAVGLEALADRPSLNYTQQACGLYANELLLCLARETAGEAIFHSYEALANDLPQASGASLEWALRHFERELLSACGYGLSLPEPLSGDALSTTRLAYVPRKGVQPVSGNPAGSIAAANLLDFLSGNNGSAADLPGLKRLMRSCLDDILGGKKLRSRELLRPLAPDHPIKTA